MKRIFAWQTDTAGCFLYRLHWPLTTLPQDQFEVTFGAPGPDIHDYDIVIGQRIAGHSDLWQELCRNPNILAVYELDDYLLRVDPENTVIYDIYAPMAEGTEQNIKMADVVTVSTPKMAAAILDLNPNVVVLPNCLPASWITSEEILPGPPNIIGWGGSMFHGRDFDGVVDALRPVLDRHPEVRFRTYGADYLKGLDRKQAHGWSTMESYHAKLDLDIGLAPLRKTYFNDMKSHCKILEYAAKGIPAVATRWGQYPEFMGEASTYLADEPSDFTELVEFLLHPTTWLTMSRFSLRRARQYTIEGNIDKWVTVYQGGVA